MVDFLRDRFNPSLKPPYRLVSLSLGGMVTLNWCQRYPEEIASAVVINSSLANLSSWYERFSLKQVGNALRYITGSADSKEAAILAMTSRQPEQHEQVVAHWGELNQQYPTSFKNALMQLKAASRFKLQQRVKPPVLCINAAGDELVSPRCSEAIANLLKVPLYTHPKAGHDLSLDDPEWLAATIHTWSENLQKEEHQLHKTELI